MDRAAERAVNQRTVRANPRLALALGAIQAVAGLQQAGLDQGAGACAGRAAGAHIREHCEIVELGHDGDRFILSDRDGVTLRAARMLNCAGAWGAALAARFGETVPLTAKAPQMVVTEPTAHFIEPVLGVPRGKFYLRQIKRGNVIFGVEDRQGLADTRTSRAEVLPEYTLAASAVAASLIPRLRRLNIIRVWTGIEGYTPDHIPVIGPSRTTPGLFHAFGFSGHGFQLGPAMGEIMGELLTTGETETPIDAFDIARFADFPNPPSPESGEGV